MFPDCVRQNHILDEKRFEIAPKINSVYIFSFPKSLHQCWAYWHQVQMLKCFRRSLAFEKKK